jgi:hypothetical protein
MRQRPSPRRAVLLIAAAVFVLASTARADDIEGVSFPVQLDGSNGAWILHGTGLLRYRIFIKGYVAALYLREKLHPEAILGDIPRRLEIAYFWSLEAEDFAKATVEGIARNVDPATYQTLQDRMDQLNALYEDVEPGDRYALTYVPGAGTELSLNGRSLGSIAGADFSSALFGIWLGEEPLDEDLRDQLLEAR